MVYLAGLEQGLALLLNHNARAPLAVYRAGSEGDAPSGYPAVSEFRFEGPGFRVSGLEFGV